MTLPATKTELLAALEAAGLAPRKGLGQHFLVDGNMLRAIVGAAEIAPGDLVLEVGPGPGLLTRHLLEAGAEVVACEIDAGFVRFLRDHAPPSAPLELVHADLLDGKRRLAPAILKALQARLAAPRPRRPPGGHGRLKVVGNIPYNISTPIICNLLESGLPIERMVFTVQREVADRLLAPPGARAYGIISVVAGLLAATRLLRPVPASVFWPRPRVESALVAISPRPRTATGEGTGYRAVTRVARAIFEHRRKTLANALRLAGIAPRSGALEAAIIAAGIDPGVRGERLDIPALARLASALGPVARG
ncbi:MAG: ribosomal RNA small subunit methyltransferase A [Planctomycetes bacterium]|nr:ribosomal RNA small subunit methyltransferase A [Planctomycetota bacterium]